MSKLKNNKDNDVEDTISDEEFIKRLKFMFKDASNIAILRHIKHMYELLHKFAKTDELIGEVRLDKLDTEFIEEQFMNSVLNRRVKGEPIKTQYYTKHIEDNNKDALFAEYVSEELIHATDDMMDLMGESNLPEDSIYYVQQTEYVIKEKIDSLVDNILKQGNADLPALPNLKCSIWSDEQEKLFNRSLKELIDERMIIVKARGAGKKWTNELKRKFVDDVYSLVNDGYTVGQAIDKLKKDAPYLSSKPCNEKPSPSKASYYKYKKELNKP